MLIAGASVAGVRTAQALRRKGFAGEITLIGVDAGLPVGELDLDGRPRKVKDRI